MTQSVLRLVLRQPGELGGKIVMANEMIVPLNGESLFGDSRLASTIEKWRDSPARELVARIFDSVREFAADAPQSDDTTCSALRYVGSARAGG